MVFLHGFLCAILPLVNGSQAIGASADVNETKSNILKRVTSASFGHSDAEEVGRILQNDVLKPVHDGQNAILAQLWKLRLLFAHLKHQPNHPMNRCMPGDIKTILVDALVSSIMNMNYARNVLQLSADLSLQWQEHNGNAEFGLDRSWANVQHLNALGEEYVSGGGRYAMMEDQMDEAVHVSTVLEKRQNELNTRIGSLNE